MIIFVDKHSRCMKTLLAPLLGFACCVMLLSGCFEKDSSYEPEQNEIVANLTAKPWTREYDIVSPVANIREIWTFERGGSGSFREIRTFENGEREDKTTYFGWIFMSTNFNVIYMNYPLYWQITELTAEKFCVNETRVDPDKVTSGDYKEYMEFTNK